MQKVLRYGIWAGLFAVLFIPFIVASDFFFPFITGKNFTFRVIVGIIFTLWLLLVVIDKDARPKPTAMWYALLLFIGALGVSALLGENPHKSFWSNFERMEGWVSMFHWGLYFTVLSAMAQTEKMWRALFFTSIAVSVLMALYGILQLAGFLTINQGGVRVDGTFGNATYLAAYMLFSFFFTLYALYRFNQTKLVQVGLIVALFLQAIMIYYSATRGTMLGLVSGLFVTGAVMAYMARGRATVRFVGVGVVVGIIVLVSGFIAVKDTDWVRGNDILARFASIGLSEGETRLTVWSMALEGVAERPIFGWGQENFNYIFNEFYRASLYAQEPWFDRAHNQFIDWLVAGGVVGLVLYVSLFAIALWYLFRRESDFDAGERALFTGFLFGYAVHSSFVFDNLMSSVLFLFLLSYIAFRGARAPLSLSFPVLSGSARIVVIVVVTLVGVSAVYFFNASGIARASGLIQALSAQPGGIQDNFALFRGLVSDGGLGRQEVHEQLIQFAIQVREPRVAEVVGAEAVNEISSFTREVFLEEIGRQPNDARLHAFFGSFLAQVGDIDGARAQFEKAHLLSEEKQSIMLQLSGLADAQNNQEEALRWAERAFSLEPRNDQARFVLVSLLFKTGLVERADALLVERYGTIFNQALAPLYFQMGMPDRLIGIAQSEGSPTLLMQAADAYVQTGRANEAIRIIEEGARVFPDFREQADQIINQIRSL